MILGGQDPQPSGPQLLRGATRKSAARGVGVSHVLGMGDLHVGWRQSVGLFLREEGLEDSQCGASLTSSSMVKPPVLPRVVFYSWFCQPVRTRSMRGLGLSWKM